MASITVTATGTAPVAEHRAVVHLGVEGHGDLPGAALATLAARVERLRGLLAERGIPDTAVATEHLSVNPRWDDRSRTPTGSTASTTVRIDAGAVEEVGPLLDAALAAVPEGVSIGQVGQVPVPDPAAEAAARRAAVDAVRDRAAQLAAAAGGTLGGLLSLLEGGPPAANGRIQLAAAVQSAGPPVHLWERSGEVAVTVTAVYELVEP